MKIPSKREINISDLVLDKFPKTRIKTNSNPFDANYFTNIDLSKRTPDLEKEFELANKYKKELSELSDKEIDKLHKPIGDRKKEARKKKIAEIEDNLFNKPHMQADFEYWNKADYWTCDEFISLSFGKNPKIINSKYVNKNSTTTCQHEGFYEQLNFPLEYFKRKELLSRSILSIKENFKEKGDYLLPLDGRRMDPNNCISWAKGKEIELPKELKSSSPDPSNDLNGQLLEQNKRLLEQTQSTMEMVGSLNTEIKKFQEENKQLKQSLKEKEDQRVIATLYKIICGITKKHYSNKTNRISQIKTTILNEAGIEINEKTAMTPKI